MASKKTLNAENLEALGARRLAELLMDIAEGNAATKRRLRLELTAREAPETMAAEVRKRLAQIARARSFADWRKVRDLAADLEAQRRAIVDQIAKRDPAEALDLMWRFMDLTEAVHERCDDSNGEIGDVFHNACRDLGPLTQAAKPDPVALADRVFTALNENGYGQYDHLIELLSPSLGTNGLDHLKGRFIELSKAPVERPSSEKRKVIGWGAGGPLHEDEIKARSRESAIRLALREIADAQGDVDAFIDQYDEKTRRVPRIAAEIARRLLAASRAEDALRTIEAAEHRRNGWPDFEWEEARIDVLEALGLSDKAQAARWSCFERALSAEHLRLSRAPTRLRRRRGRRAGARSCGALQQPASGVGVLGVLARLGSCRTPRDPAGGGTRWRPLRDPRASRRCARRQASACRNAGTSRDDRVHAYQGSVEPLSPCGPAFHGVREPRIRNQGVRRLRDARSLCCPAES